MPQRTWRFAIVTKLRTQEFKTSATPSNPWEAKTKERKKPWLHRLHLLRWTTWRLPEASCCLCLHTPHLRQPLWGPLACTVLRANTASLEGRLGHAGPVLSLPHILSIEHQRINLLLSDCPLRTESTVFRSPVHDPKQCLHVQVIIVDWQNKEE